MNKDKKLKMGILTVACLGILALSTPTYAGFFDWFKNTPLNQEAAALRAVKRVSPTPSPTGNEWIDMGDGDCVVEGAGWGTIVGSTCIGAGWEAYDMAQARTGATNPTQINSRKETSQTPSPAGNEWIDMGDGDCVVEGVGWGTIVGSTCIGAGWEAYDMAQARTGANPVKPTVYTNTAKQVSSGGQSAVKFQKEMRVGDAGADILNLQRTLSSLGYYKNVIDGKYGSATKDAVKAFQRAQGQYLTTGAVVGSKTIENLNASLVRMPVTETEGPYNPLPAASVVDKTKTMAKGVISTVVELVGWHNGTCVNGDIFPDGTYTIYSYASGCGSGSPVFQ